MADDSSPPNLSAQQDCCRKLVDSVSGERYFAHVSRAGGQGFRLEITDCTNAWIAEVKEPPRDAMIEEWMSLAQKAIAPRLFRNTGGPSSFSYRLFRDPTSGDLKIQWSWGVQKIKASVLATRQSHDAGRSVAAELMDALVDKHEALQEEHSELTSAFLRLRDEATWATEELERAQGEMQRLEEQLCTKFAALLNEKKRRCKALNEEVTALRQQLDDQAEGSSGTSGRSGGGDDDEEDDGRSELSREETRQSRGATSRLGSSRMEEDTGKQGEVAVEATPVSKRRRSLSPEAEGEEQQEKQEQAVAAAASPPRPSPLPPEGSCNSGGVRETVLASSGTHSEGHNREGDEEEAVLRRRWEERRGAEDLAAATVPLSADEGQGAGEPGSERKEEGKQQQQQPGDEEGAEGEVKLKARRRKRPKGAA